LGNFAKALFLPDATVVTGNTLWFDNTADIGQYDPLRFQLVTGILVFRTVGYAFLDFPTAKFVSSVQNSIVVSFKKIWMVTMEGRFRMIQVSLLVMLWSVWDFGGADLDAVFRPLHCSFDGRRRWELELETYIVPLFVHFLIIYDRVHRPVITIQFLENVLQMCDYVSGTEIVRVMLRVLCHLVCLPELDGILCGKCTVFPSDSPVVLGSWGFVLLQVAVRVAESHPGGGIPRVFARIIARRLPEIMEMTEIAIRRVIMFFADSQDSEARLNFLKTVRRIIGLKEHVKFSAVLLASSEFLDRLDSEYPDDQVVLDVLGWAKARTF
jgi:hypothetical protein